MTWPTNAERAGWFAQQHERPMPLEGHQPAQRMLAAGQFLPSCRTDKCIDDDPGLLMHADPEAAIDDARIILTHRIHGESA